MTKNKREQIKKLDEELQLLERRIKHIEQIEKNKRKNEERRKRTRRLIETGALAEKYFEIHDLTIEQREELFNMFSSFIKANKPDHLK